VRRRDDGGSAVLEFVALLPVHMSFIMAVVFVGKINNASANVEAAARSAARTMSIGINRDVGAAEDISRDQAADVVDAGGSFCTNADTFFDAAIAGNDPPADPATVTVTITCTVDLSQATGMGLPGEREVTAVATEVIDPYREEPAP
jgi:Flp pilus assembly protein TadG